MKLQLMAAAAVFALIGGAASATEQGGYVGGSYDRTNIDVDGLGDADVDVWSLQGSYTAPLSGAWGVQLDGDVTNYDLEGQDVTIVTPGAHVFYETSFGRVGAFGGVAFGDDSNLWGVGAEGQFNVAPQWTLHAAAGFGQLESDVLDDADVDINVWSVRGEARYFVTENTRLDASANWMNLNLDGLGADEDTKAWTLGAGAEHQFAAYPVSVFGRYEHTSLNDFDVDADSIRVGVRWSFGPSGSTLQSRDRSGASSPTFGDAFGGAAVQGVAGAFGSLLGEAG